MSAGRMGLPGIVAMLVGLGVGAGAQEPRVVLRGPGTSGELTVGEPFVVTVEAHGTAPRLQPVPSQWHPLVVEAVQQQNDADGRVRFLVTVRSYRAGECDVGPVQVGFGDGRTVASGVLRLDLRSSLPEPPGELEWPGDVRELPAPRWPWWLAAGGLAGLGWLLRRRQRPARAVEVLVPVQPALDVGARLQALPLPQRPADWEPFCTTVKALLRTHLTTNHALRAEVATSEELLRALAAPRPTVPPSSATGSLAACLSVCDQVLFGAVRPLPASSAQVRDAAVAFVQGSAATTGTVAGTTTGGAS